MRSGLLADPVRERREHRHRRFGTLSQQGVDRFSADDEAADPGILGDDGRGARPFPERLELAPEIPTGVSAG
jgi:hypothetical protein